MARSTLLSLSGICVSHEVGQMEQLIGAYGRSALQLDSTCRTASRLISSVYCRLFIRHLHVADKVWLELGTTGSVTSRNGAEQSTVSLASDATYLATKPPVTFAAETMRRYSPRGHPRLVCSHSVVGSEWLDDLAEDV